MLISTPYSDVDGEHVSWGWHVIMSILDNGPAWSKLLCIVSDIPGRIHNFISSGSGSGFSGWAVVKGLGIFVAEIGLHSLKYNING